MPRGIVIHGQNRRGRMTPEYRAYKQARQRCLNPKNPNYKDYGGRGIKFLFDSFNQWFAELGQKPSRKHSVDRKDNNKHYEPGNVRWATLSEQRLNRRKFRLASNNTSGITGVSQHPRGSWMAYGYRHGINQNLGYFKTKEEAIAARLAWESRP